MQYILMALFVAAVTVADQITKWLVVENFPLHGLHAPNRWQFCISYGTVLPDPFSFLSWRSLLFYLYSL